MAPRVSFRFACRVSLVALFACRAAFAAEAPVYRTPPAAIADILSAPRLPRGAPLVSPDGAWIAQPDLRSLIPIATLAEPVEKLAGYEILPGLRAQRRELKVAASGLACYAIAGAHKVRAQLPAAARVGRMVWSNKGDRVACALYGEGGAELWIVDAATGAAHRVDGVHLQGVPATWFEWSNDDAALLCALVPPGAAPAIATSRVPAGPSLRQTSGRAAPQRTARDVLHTPADQARFAWFATTQLARVVPATAAIQPLGEPVALADVSVSPDEKWLLMTRFALPAPLGFPAELFPTLTELWPLAGGPAIALGSAPLNDRSAIASTAPLGAREFTWAPDARSLWAVSWEDRAGADAGAAVRDTTLPPPGSDRVLRWDAPFTNAPREIARCATPVRELLFGADGARLIVSEFYEPRRLESQWWLDTHDPAKRAVLVRRSSEGVYDDPGPVIAHRVRHTDVAWLSGDGRSFFRSGQGFRAEGQRPFLDRCAFAGGKPVREFESDDKHLESVVALLSTDAHRFLTLRESATEPPNYFLRRSGETLGRALTDFTDPAPAITRAQRIQFEFTRPDGVKLHAEAVLPADWKPGTALPTLFWIYPNDYRSAAAASQNHTSPNRFPPQSSLNPEVLVTQGYAVVKPDLAIVGTNDRYVPELQMSAQAAVDECVRRGFTDRDRIAVAGHSYGAFSTVNCLAHTRLFRAGLASDGAYNRTLTPFTFQAETRSLWEAKDTYLQMSPFLYANAIEAPLLLMHNQDDTNVGTNPIQSDRLFEALNGLGKTSELVQYPFEDHGPVARETVLDYWARALDWFDRYVKTAPARTAASAQP